MSDWKQLAGGLVFIGGILIIDTLILVEPVETPEGMIWLESGTFLMGSDQGLLDERPAHEVHLNGFWIDQYEVTNADFANFVAETGYITYSEQVSDSLVFESPAQNSSQSVRPMPWWKLVANANWRQPAGDQDSIEGKENHPVVQVTYEDAQAYCTWLGKDLPTEAQFEYAARGGLEGEIYSWGSQPRHKHEAMTNHWQGAFPFHNENSDGYADTAPVGSFPPNNYGLYDITGNVWEWVSDWYHPNYYANSPLRNPQGVAQSQSLDPNEPALPKRSIRGGSFLCSENFCSGFRVSARMPAEPTSSTNHTGFRCVANRATIFR
ncbi:MAG: formylglycine-generating enzyme family protein [Gammaproteobacteria bacterium]|nr:formylglycine-generating enzyme family protein [Gammaproteobacteria bacterium]MDD9959398.1 formylglycine-generating enzyme family protein [Gammaproteobacteria bacterium]